MTTRNLVLFYDLAVTEGSVFYLVIVQKGMSVRDQVNCKGLVTC